MKLDGVDEAFMGLAFWRASVSGGRAAIAPRPGCDLQRPQGEGVRGRGRRHWKLGYSGVLGFWRPTRGQGRPPTDRSGFKRWVAEGGEGRFLLSPDAVRDYLETLGLDAERVMVDLKDRGVTEADPGHSTKLCWPDGKTKRFMVLPDRFVRSRSPWTLGSVVGHNKGRAAGRSGLLRS